MGAIEIIDAHLTIDGNQPSTESKVHADGILAGEAQTPDSGCVVEFGPASMSLRSDGDRIGHRIAWCESETVSLFVFESQHLDIETR